jgi:peptidoglycan/LPS O-acetylase OafA/YrhL
MPEVPESAKVGEPESSVASARLGGAEPRRIPSSSTETNAGEVAGSVALDQWRGFALVMVLISHGLYYTGKVSGIGRVGVNLFFFISGLLTYRSLVRSSAPDSFSRAKSFWKRRFLRLYPALVGYLVLMIPTVYFFAPLVKGAPGSTFAEFMAHLPQAFGAFINFTGPPCHTGLNHLWSLSTEIQFYLIAPILFALGGTSSARRSWVWGGLLVIFLALGAAQPLVGDRVKYYFQFSVWPMLLGFVAEWQRARFVQFFSLFSRPILITSAAVFLLSLVLMQLGPKAKIGVVALGAFMVVPCYCCYLVGLPCPGKLGNLLKWCGERTYSIYLWQQPLTLCGYFPTWLHPVGALLSCAAGALGFHWLERPFLSRKRKPAPAGVTQTAEVCPPVATSAR